MSEKVLKKCAHSKFASFVLQFYWISGRISGQPDIRYNPNLNILVLIGSNKIFPVILSRTTINLSVKCIFRDTPRQNVEWIRDRIGNWGKEDQKTGNVKSIRDTGSAEIYKIRHITYDCILELLKDSTIPWLKAFSRTNYEKFKDKFWWIVNNLVQSKEMIEMYNIYPCMKLRKINL